MQTNKISYVCFLVVCGLVLLDMYLSSNIALQLLCCVLVLVCVGLGVWVAVKHAKGTYYTAEQAHNLQSYLSENIALNAQIKALGDDVHKAKKLALTSPEVQDTVLQNRRLAAQIANLQTRVAQLSELLAIAQQNKQTAVVAMPTNTEQVRIA